MLLHQDDITNFLPQRPPFVMVDQLLHASPSRIVTRFQVREDNVFLDGDLLREYALIENMAQSSAAGIAYQKLSDGESGPADIEGFLVGISDLFCFELPSLHDCLKTVMVPLHEFGHLIQLRGEIFVDAKLILSATIKLAGMPPSLS